jgi:hypothetical protein
LIGVGGDLIGVGGGETRQDVAQVAAHAYPQALATLHHADDGGDRWGGTGGPDVQPVLSSQRAGPDALFASVMPPPDLCRVHKLEAYFPRVCHCNHFPHAA